MEAEVRESRKALQAALNIGAQMLSSGAEISRVEDSIIRMCPCLWGGDRGMFCHHLCDCGYHIGRESDRIDRNPEDKYL